MYIRKLKYVSEVSDFSEENNKNHKFIDVVRPYECSKNYFTKFHLTMKDKEFPPFYTSLGPQLQEF
jgi:hypothetical protein